jgi:hypothetical protein
MTAPLVEAGPRALGLGPDVHHLLCCDPDVAMCGQDVSGHPFTDGVGEIPCPLCRTVLAERQPCPVADCRYPSAA